MADPLCFEALKAITQHQLITVDEERSLLAALNLSERCKGICSAEFVTTCYATKLNKCVADNVATNQDYSVNNTFQKDHMSTDHNSFQKDHMSTDHNSFQKDHMSTVKWAGDGDSVSNLSEILSKSQKNVNPLFLNKLPESCSYLEENLDILTARAECLYNKFDYAACFAISSKVSSDTVLEFKKKLNSFDATNYCRGRAYRAILMDLRVLKLFI